MTDKILVFSTCETEEEATRVAHSLVEKKLAACVNIVPGARSIYRWHGKVEDAKEFLLAIKSRRDLFDRLRGELEHMHSYEVPEAIAVPVVDGSERYLDWIESALSPQQTSEA
jgi:periplasmic divalent cation tolerance protein